ncbi:hypothetical protein K4K61_000152 [Colletotrichum sp. SAR11_59]|nr:hypothetical protein K4K61_000152 [Colletotrichum sp. SAR11_59]
MSDFRYLPFPLPADATLTLTTTITRDLSTPIPTTTAPPSITTNSLQDPSQTLSITTITLRVTDAPSNSSSILSTAISSSPTPTPTPTPSGPAHKPTVRGDITPTFYILALVPILVMILCAYESYTYRKIDAKQKHITTTRAAAPRNHPNGDIELQDLSTAPAAPLRQYWWFEDDTVTDQATDTAPAAAETDLVPSRPSTPDWAAGIPSYYNNGRSPTLNYSSSVSSCSSTSVADVDMIPPGMTARAAGKLPAKP